MVYKTVLTQKQTLFQRKLSIFVSHLPPSPSRQQLKLLSSPVCTEPLSTYKILIPTHTVKKRAKRAPLDPAASHSLRSFVKHKLEVVGRNADGERESEAVIIINIYIPLQQNGKIYTAQPSYNQVKYISQRCTAARLSPELGMNVFIMHCCCIPNGDNL